MPSNEITAEELDQLPLPSDFTQQAKRFRDERNNAWDEFLDLSAQAGYSIKNTIANRSLFMAGFESGKENATSLQAQLVQAEDAYSQLHAERSLQLASTQKALKGLYNAVQKSRSVNDPLGMATAMDEAGEWF